MLLLLRPSTSTYVQAPATARAMASAARTGARVRRSPAGRSAFHARSTTGRSRGTRTNYVARPALPPFPLLSAILVGFLLSRPRGGPSCVRERWSCGRQVGRRARPPCGGGGWTQAHAGVRCGRECNAWPCCSTPYGSGAPVLGKCVPF